MSKRTRKKHKIIEVAASEQKPNRKAKREEEQKANKETVQIKPLSAADIKGKRYLIMKDGAIRFCGSCKLDEAIPYSSGQVVIDEVVPNEGDDRDKYPFIATKVSQVKS